MNNAITNWSYDPPTEPGVYLCCYGDVETWSNISVVELSESPTIDALTGPALVNQLGDSLRSYSSACKWARLLVGQEARDANA